VCLALTAEGPVARALSARAKKPARQAARSAKRGAGRGSLPARPQCAPRLCVCARTQIPEIAGADPMAASLLIECRGQTDEALQVRGAGCL